ncbi:MAG: Calx-beta domain-containing protein [Planctomycetota bacterium]
MRYEYGWITLANKALNDYLKSEFLTDKTITLRLTSGRFDSSSYWVEVCTKDSNAPPRLLVTHNAPPVAGLANVTTPSVTGPFPFTADLSGATTTDDGDLRGASFYFDFDYVAPTFTVDFIGTGATPWLASHTYAVDGTYSAALKVTDGRGASNIATVSVVVADNFLPGTFNFTHLPTAPFVGIEGTPVTISVARTGGKTGVATVDIVTTDDTAVNGVDYDGTTQTVSFGALEMGVKDVVFTLTDNGSSAPPKYFDIALANATVAAIGTSAHTGTVRIMDNDTKSSGSSGGGGCLPGTGAGLALLGLAGLAWFGRKRD